MDRARISQLRDHLSRYLDRVRAGGEVLVLDRNRPIARLVPVAGSNAASTADSQRLLALERLGLLRRGGGRLPQGWSRRRQVKVKGSVLADLLRDRESGW
jgi:prevent-host-death family protein